MSKYNDEKTMEDDDSDINAQDDGLPLVCGCGDVFEMHEGRQSSKTGKVICTPCYTMEAAEEVAQEVIAGLLMAEEKKYKSLRAQLSISEGRIKTLKSQLV